MKAPSLVLASALLWQISSLAHAQGMSDTADRISRFLESNQRQMAPQDVREIYTNLQNIEYVLQSYGYDPSQTTVFRNELDGTTLKIYARDTNTLLYTWNNHKDMQVRGDVVGLTDSTGEFAALSYRNGVKTILVEKWRDTIFAKVQRDYIGLVDSKGISEIWSTKEQKTLLKNWKNTQQFAFETDFIVLLDNEAAKNFEVFTVSGERVLRLRGVSSFSMVGRKRVSYVQNGEVRTIDLTGYLP